LTCISTEKLVLLFESVFKNASLA